MESEPLLATPSESAPTPAHKATYGTAPAVTTVDTKTAARRMDRIVNMYFGNRACKLECYGFVFDMRSRHVTLRLAKFGIDAPNVEMSIDSVRYKKYVRRAEFTAHANVR